MSIFYELVNHASEKTVWLRSLEGNAYYLDAIRENEANESIYDVAKPRVFSCLLDYNVLLFSPPDIIHDLFERVLPHTLQSLVKYFVQNCKISMLSDNNSKLLAMKLTYSCNMPCCLRDSVLVYSNHLTGTAA